MAVDRGLKHLEEKERAMALLLEVTEPAVLPTELCRLIVDFSPIIVE